MRRKRITQLFPFLLPVRRAQRKIIFYAKMYFDQNRYAKTILRKRIGLSQASLAERFGVSTQAVSKWETGLALPDIELLLEMSYLFDIPLNSLLEGEDDFMNSAAMTKMKLPEKLDKVLTSKKDRQLLCPRFLLSIINHTQIKI